jgi:homoserine dehydrogenase
MNFDSQSSVVDIGRAHSIERGQSAIIAAVRSLAQRQPTPQRVQLVLAGARGRVASALRAQLAREQPALLNRAGIELIVAGVFDRRGALFDPNGIVPLSVAQRLTDCAPTPTQSLIEHIHALPGPVVFIDATGSAEWAAEYPHLLRAGIGIATPNKRAHSGSYREWSQLREAALMGRAPIHYETTVAAALPVISTLRNLQQCGERVLSIEGVLSGSLSFILTRVQQGIALSEAVAEAIRLGYTEPDPLEDLDFVDLRRKLLILVREAGQRLEPEQVRVESLLPRGATLAALLTGAFDNAWRHRAHTARASGQTLVAVAQWQTAGQARIYIRAETKHSPLARLTAGENIVRIRTEYHDAIPICISGPGAGPAVTAAGIFSDVLAASRALCALAAPTVD